MTEITCDPHSVSLMVPVPVHSVSIPFHLGPHSIPQAPSSVPLVIPILFHSQSPFHSTLLLMQILSGMYPIAQVREPYTAVGYLAERMPLVKLLQLEHPDSLDALVSKNKARSRARQSPPSSDGSRDKVTISNEASDRDELWDPSQAAGGDPEEVWTAWNICDGELCTRSSQLHSRNVL